MNLMSWSIRSTSPKSKVSIPDTEPSAYGENPAKKSPSAAMDWAFP